MTNEHDCRTLDRRALLALMLAAAVTPAAAQPAGIDPDAVYDRLLSRYVSVGKDGVNRVDYARWRANADDRKALDAYVLDLAARKPSAMSRDEPLRIGATSTTR